MTAITTTGPDEDFAADLAQLVEVGNGVNGAVVESLSAWLCGLELVCDGHVAIHWAITPEEWFANNPSVQYA